MSRMGFTGFAGCIGCPGRTGSVISASRIPHLTWMAEKVRKTAK
ncbi:hypothetical protein STRIP9103_07151 [Streptomyces ipomoeae 91-03]|uniref:Uncharacterized protein n=1 Tax=Streptomyces ipomoeae 91-03 TaxID=698759 RepID=L1KRH6_9ACTN|nr:hypothetical protein STRIP9103_07151 [Streptomyces ipomoeae 91-03]